MGRQSSTCMILLAMLVVDLQLMVDGFTMTRTTTCNFIRSNHSRSKNWLSIYMMNTNTPDDQPPPSLFSILQSSFQGDFDNYSQVYLDRKNGLLPREGGGHEHFHATLLPISTDSFPRDLFPGVEENSVESLCSVVVAAYYFEGMPNRIFRLRMYTLYCDNEVGNGDGDDEERVKMKLYTFDPSLEGQLRKESERVIENWEDIISNHVSMHGHASFKELERCDILWTKEPNSIRHAYLETYLTSIDKERCKDPAIHAVMVNDHEKGGVLLESQMMPGSYIRIQDELSLWKNELWINDRGHDAESKAMVYGNWGGVPYQMNRVASLKSSQEGSFEREIVDPQLVWTLGDLWRTPEEYDSKMEAVGGIATKMNKNTNTKK